jgi:hypothetical protein
VFALLCAATFNQRLLNQSRDVLKKQRALIDVLAAARALWLRHRAVGNKSAKVRQTDTAHQSRDDVRVTQDAHINNGSSCVCCLVLIVSDSIVDSKKRKQRDDFNGAF